MPIIERSAPSNVNGSRHSKTRPGKSTIIKLLLEILEEGPLTFEELCVSMDEDIQIELIEHCLDMTIDAGEIYRRPDGRYSLTTKVRPS